MKRLVGFSVLGFLAWTVLTVGWAAASHLGQFPGPGQTAEGSMNLAANAVTVVDLPGALGTPQRTAARQLRNAGDAAARFYRGPERAVGRFLDQIAGHKHGHDHHYRVTERVRFSAPGARMHLVRPMTDQDRERVRDRMRHLRDRLEHRLEARHQEIEIRMETTERVRRELELANQELLEKLENIELQEFESNNLKDEIKKKIERELDRVLRELKRLDEFDGTIMIDDLDLDGVMMLDDLDLDLSFLEEISFPEINVEVSESGNARIIRIKKIDN